MKPIRLGVIFDQQIGTGGGYQQALNAALLVKQLSADLVEPIYFTTLKENTRTLLEYGINAIHLDLSLYDIAWIYFLRFIQSGHIIKIIKYLSRQNPFERALNKQKIDLVYFLSPSSRAIDLEKLNYITTVWDLCHRDDPEFPEVRWERQLESREKNFRALLPRATAIFVDSTIGKANVIHRYGIDEDRIHVMPFQGAVTTRLDSINLQANEFDVREKYDLKFPYIFYPAQFWAHKNHVYVLNGLKSLESKYGLVVGAIFAGGDRGNAEYVEEYAARLGITERVRFVGFVSNQEIKSLYKQSLALVMPTYFGPTNLPPLEAFGLGVPVLYSDKAGLREQVGDAALLMNLKAPETMADHLHALIKDQTLRDRLIMAGKNKLRQIEAIDRIAILQGVIEDFRWRRLCWK